MKMKLRLCALSVALVVGMSLTGRAQSSTTNQYPNVGHETESGYNVWVWAMLGPVRENTNATVYDQWSTNVVAYIYAHGQPQSWLDLNHMLKVDEISQMTPACASNTVTYAVRIARKSWAPQFKANRLRFRGVSSDQNHYLNSNASLDSDPNFTPSMRLYCINWTGGNPRVSDTVHASSVDGKLSDLDIDECIFIGAQSTYFTYNDQAHLDAINAYVMGYTNFSLTGTWTLVDGSNAIVGWGSKTISTKVSPLLPIQTVTSQGDKVLIGLNSEPGVTAQLLSAPSVMGPYGLEGTINAGDIYVRPNNGQGYYRLLIQ